MYHTFVYAIIRAVAKRDQFKFKGKSKHTEKKNITKMLSCEKGHIYICYLLYRRGQQTHRRFLLVKFNVSLVSGIVFAQGISSHVCVVGFSQVLSVVTGFLWNYQIL